jgi:hypothetical protein
MQPTEQVNAKGLSEKVWRPVLSESRVDYKIGRALASTPYDFERSVDNGSRLESHRDAANEIIEGTRPTGFFAPTDYEEALEAAASKRYETEAERQSRQAAYRAGLGAGA